MKSKKRQQSSSDDESDDSETSKMSNSSSGSDSEDSSTSEHRYKKKRKRADSSESETDSNDQKRSKKRKHKKKKKKHGKKKRHTETVEVSDSGEELSSVSEGEISPKKKRKHKHKHKHSKRARSSSASAQEEFQLERRLHSVVKERRGSSEDSQPSRTYYQKEYRRSGSGQDEYEREREVQRFYRGSSKERRNQYVEHYQYERGNNDRYTARQEKYDRNRDKYVQSGQIVNPNEEYTRRLREYDEYKRPQRYEERRYPEEEYHRKPREESYHIREDSRGNNRYNQYEDRAPKRREFDDSGRDYRERRSGPPEGDRYRERDKKEKYREERPSSERDREDLRERVHRPDRPPAPIQRERPKSRSPEDRYRDKNRREERGDEHYGREEKRDNRDERRDTRGERRDTRDDRRDPRDDRQPRPARSESYKEERDNRVVVKTEPGTRERKSRFETDDKQYAWGKDVKKEGDTQGDKEKPNFGLSGKLTADVNTVNGVVIKYTEPDDAKQPKRRWRFYPFKGDKALPILYIHRQSYFIIGRDKKVVDIILEHPSISKQHAALQYRATPFTRADGSQGRRVRPYVIDLESANGTFVNNKKIEPRRYVELLERDVVKFGFSQREYVLLHENSKDEAMDDDNNDPPAIGVNVTTTHQLKQEKRIKEEMVADGD